MITSLGARLGPEVLAAVQELYRGRQLAFVAAQPAGLSDAVYGADPRQRLDLYLPGGAVTGAPVVLWVHGGGFVRGEKAAADHPYNAHIGRWAARHGMVGAVMNYRLAPAHSWPAGGEDVGAAIAWLRDHASDHGGDPRHIVAVGTSAGAVHIATYLQLCGPRDRGLAGIGLLSGFYGFTALDERDIAYFGAPEEFAERQPQAAVVATTLPLLLACAEHDPPRFQAEFAGLLAARLQRHGVLPPSLVAAGHNHFSLASHIGADDDQPLALALHDLIARAAPETDR